jgi:hypothetical protein
MIRLLNMQFCEPRDRNFHIVEVWREFTTSCFEYFINLSKSESCVFHSLPNDLFLHQSISHMSPLVFRMYILHNLCCTKM